MSEENVFDIKKAREFYFDDTKITNPDGYTSNNFTIVIEAIKNDKIKLLDMAIDNQSETYPIV
jgi:hypothetical protein